MTQTTRSPTLEVMGADTLQVLTNCDNPPRAQNKMRVWENGAWRKVDRKFGFLFTSHVVTVSSLADLARELDALSADPLSVVVRGTCTNPGTPQRRLFQAGRAEGNTLTPTAHHWVMFDLDDIDYPAPDFAKRPQETLEAFKATLPAPWRDAACYWQASGSAGLSPTLKAHLWFWLDRAVDEAYLKAWFPHKTIGPYQLDTRVFSPAQLHYVARPALIGAPDPMEVRSGMIPGEAEVKTPGAQIIAFSPATYKRAKRTLKDMCEELAVTPDGERSDKLYLFGCMLGRSSCLEDRYIISALADAVMGTTPPYPYEKAQAQVTNGLRTGRAEREANATSWRAGLRFDEAGEKIVPCMGNYLHLLREHPDFAGKLAWQDRGKTVDVLGDLPWRSDAQTWKESDDTNLRAWLEKLGVTARKGDVQDAVLAVAEQQAHDPFKTWLLEQKWDGVARLQHMHALFEVETTPYAQATFAWWLISAVARTFRPGCQVDHMLILQSPQQGMYKSSVFEALVPSPRYFTTFGGSAYSLYDKDAKSHLHGPVLVCIDEMAAFRGRDADAVKHFITERTDRFRPSYGRVTLDFPRTNVFCGTSNATEFLPDVTGGRRFWPHFVCRPIDTSRIAALRGQLWAEAVHRFQMGERWYPTPEETVSLGLAEQQAARRIISGPEELLAEALSAKAPPGQWEAGQLDEAGRVAWFKTSQLTWLVPLDPVKNANAVSDALRALGWVKHSNGRFRYWKRGE